VGGGGGVWSGGGVGVGAGAGWVGGWACVLEQQHFPAWHDVRVPLTHSCVLTFTSNSGEPDTPSADDDSFVMVTAADASDTPSPYDADDTSDDAVTVTRVEPFTLDPEAEADEYVPSDPRMTHPFERAMLRE
jgi:hypothetical protein